MGTIIDTGPHIVVRFTQGCCEDGCENIWTLTRSAMYQISDADWGGQRCRRHLVLKQGHTALGKFRGGNVEPQKHLQPDRRRA